MWAQGGIAAAVGEGDTPSQHAHDTIVAGRRHRRRSRGQDGRGGGARPHPRSADVRRAVRPRSRRALRSVAGGRPLAEARRARLRRSRRFRHHAGADRRRARDAVDPRARALRGRRPHPDGRAASPGFALSAARSGGNGTYDLIPASAVVLATGGIGSLYAVTTNPAYARGEAIAFAARAGAVIADAEFVQFHPTAIDLGLRPRTAGDRGPARRRRDADQHGGRALHDATASGRRACSARHRRSRRLRELAAKRGAFLDAREAIGARFADAFPTELCGRDVGRHRPDARAHPGCARRALPHGRRLD